jgi:shikimate kinase
MSQQLTANSLTKASGKTTKATPRIRVRPQRSSTAAGARCGNAVFLVGFMGAGKTSVGRVLGQRLNWVFEDLDDRIEARERRTVADIFRDSGETEFRRAEHAALQQILEELRGGIAKIVALGGGAFVQKENAALLSASGLPTIFLDAPVEELWQRCCTQAGDNGTERPLLHSLDEFRRLYEIRRRNYSRASLRIQTGNRTVEKVVAEIAEVLILKRIAMRTEEGDVE